MSFLAIPGKELRDILREKTIAIALVVQAFIAAFSTFLTVGLLALYDPSAANAHPQADIAYVGPGGFDAVLRTATNLHLQTPADPVAAFAAGTLDAVIQERNGTDGVRTITLLVPEGELKSTLLVTQLRDLLQRYEHDLRAANQDRLQHTLVELPAPDRAQAAVPYAFLYSTLLPLLLLTPVFLSGAIAGDAISAELQRGTLVLLRSAPVSLGKVLAGKLLVPIVLAPLQFVLWAALLALNRHPVHQLLLVLAESLLLTVILTGVGVAIAARLRKDGPTQAAYALAAILLAVGAVFLPRDPLNLAATLATGTADGATWATFAALAVAAAVAAGAGITYAARTLRKTP